MILSKKWLADYVKLSMSTDELTERLTLTGLNLEGVETVGDDTVIDLEVTSNRPDCLGHIGVAREIAVLWDEKLHQPDPQPKATGPKNSVSVEITCPQLCSRYTARVIRGVKIGPSPDWLAERLRSLGIAVVNNVVDISNYVLFECGQPLHTFDLGKIAGEKIIVREAREGEEFTAIDHKTYKLSAGTCVIADAERAVALGGVMGGADTEVSETTTDLLIESADFDPLSTRTTARTHHLHSPSSYRFERGVDPEGIDWASRRCCELILELAGGELDGGPASAGRSGEATESPEIKLRFPQIPRLLGIDVPESEVRQILTDLGCRETHHCDHCVKVIAPTWRADLTREVDLLEEIARIHGYEKIPEDGQVRMAPSHRSHEDIVLERVRRVVTAAGFDEAMTLSTVEPELVDAFRPWTDAAPLLTSTPVLRRANALRQSVVPSLLGCRKTNLAMSNRVVEQFEIAKVYLPRMGQLPDERRMLALASGGEFLAVKGVVETILTELAIALPLTVRENSAPAWLASSRAVTLHLGESQLGILGELSSEALDQWDLRGPVTIAEIDLAPLLDAAEWIPRAVPFTTYPPISRDLNVVFDEAIRWADVEQIVRTEGGELVERLAFMETYRDADRLGAGKKSLVWTLTLRSAKGTLTSEKADAVRDRIVAKLAKDLGGELRA